MEFRRVLFRSCTGSADLAKAVPNELAARTIAVTIRRAIIGILPSLLEAVADRLRNALNQVGRATRLSPIFPEKWPMSNANRSEEHTSKLQSLMRNSSAVFCLKKQKKNNT